MGRQRTLLLIGSGGFVGGHVARVAGEEGRELRVVEADLEGATLGCDLLDPASVRECVATAAPDLIVNMAGAASVAASWRDPGFAFALNATGVLNLLEAVVAEAPGAHLLCVSSAEVYGEPRPERLPFTEDAPLEPVNPYGAAKLAMEALCGQYGRSRDVEIAIVRAFNQLGPGQDGAFAASSFARQIAAAEVAGAERAEMKVGNLEAARDFTDVRDTARAFVEISSRGLTGTFNLSSGRALTLTELVDEMTRAATIPVEVETDPSLLRPADPSVAYGSAEALREAIGWEPEIPLHRTVADLLAWWRERLAAA